MALNYFVCTLDQARKHQDPQREQDTVSNFLSFQERVSAKTSAVAFVYPNTSLGAKSTPTRRKFSFQDLYRGCWYAAKLFLDRGFPQGQTVALLCSSTPEFLFTLFALIRLEMQCCCWHLSVNLRPFLIFAELATFLSLFMIRITVVSPLKRRMKPTRTADIN